MRLHEWGRIVKDVNTTPDVGVDEIPRQAKKFGNTVDKDGKPPTLSTKVKGKSTNVLFNLGLAEDETPRFTAKEWALMEGGHSIEEETPRNKNAVIFNLDLFEEKADAKTRRNYNEFAKFCVDTLGIQKFPKITMTSAALDRTFGYFDMEEQSITVSYNRRHQMDTMRTLAHELVHCKQREEREELDGSDGSPDENEANAMAGVLLRRWADKNPTLFSETENSIFEALEEAWSEKYKRSINCNNPKGFSQKAHCAGRKKNEAAPATAPLPELRPKNFDQIVARYKNKKPSALVELLKKFAPDILILIAAAIGLAHLSFLQKFFIKQGINFSKKQMQKAMAQAESIEENFADGKVKGKSRPGRVKRAGASCNGSVTELRRKAKNASGEKAKMYHWCANMKAGRNK
jgi:hypothetical protein